MVQSWGHILWHEVGFAIGSGASDEAIWNIGNGSFFRVGEQRYLSSYLILLLKESNVWHDLVCHMTFFFFFQHGVFFLF